MVGLSHFVIFLSILFFVEPGLLEELARRVEAAEAKFQAVDLDLRLKELEAAKQRQVCPWGIIRCLHFCNFIFNINLHVYL